MTDLEKIKKAIEITRQEFAGSGTDPRALIADMLASLLSNIEHQERDSK